jgi:type I restriction enzyme S subunit
MMSCIATIGKCGITDRPSFTNQQINSVVCNHNVDAKFLYYVFTTLAPSLEAAGGGGSVYINVSKSRFEDITVLLPPSLKEQRAIACILGALDDKIELNRKMNKTLEEMARAIFKSWFVDFDPVHAKAAARREHPSWTNAQVSRAACPKLKPEIAALFPDSFEDSELGEIPKGWRIRPIGEVVQVLGGSTPSTKETAYWEGGIHPFCTPKDMASLTDSVLLQTERHLTDEGLAKVGSGQLPVGTVLLSSRAPIGYLAVAETSVSINQGIIAMVCDCDLPNLYVLYWTSANMERVIANANGSTFLEISKRNFRPITALIPKQDILHRFTQIVEPLHQRVILSHKQIQHLVTVRDALLPKLISGDLAITEAERIAERCA